MTGNHAIKYFLICYIITACSSLSINKECDAHSDKTVFQTSASWNPKIDVRPDGVLVYGFNNFQNRSASWINHGYNVHFMTGIAWGNYQDYFNGTWDGNTHIEESQMDSSGMPVMHSADIPYIVPTMNFVKYMKEKIHSIIDQSVTSIFLEEPEFFSKSGYSESFKKEWHDYYGFPWKPQNESHEMTYLSNKLKYYLYYRALDEIFSDAKVYGEKKGLQIKCFVPTHSLINYSIWNIVSPEASLASLPAMDGYIAQVWTGTSRSPIMYQGTYGSRIFENAYLEYNCLKSMTEPTGRKVYFLTDPIEDAVTDWDDYKKGYEATYTAEIMFPAISDFEIMPWPERIYMKKYKTSSQETKMEYIPDSYATQIQIMVNTLMDMPSTNDTISGPKGIGVIMSNSIMFQRSTENNNGEDERLSDFYGLTMPLVKRGIPVEIVHMENLQYPKTLEKIKLLVMSYTNQKPLDSMYHEHLYDWVKAGGILVYSSRDDDEYNSVREWWNEKGRTYSSPSEHLFEKMCIPKNCNTGEYNVGKGKVFVMRNNPREYVLRRCGDNEYLSTISSLYERYVGPMYYSNTFKLERDKYVIISVMEESITDTPYVVKGCFIDLFDANLQVIDKKQVHIGSQALLLDMSKVDHTKVSILATAARVYDENRKGNNYSFKAIGPDGIKAVTRVYIPNKPRSVKINDVESFDDDSWNSESNTYLLNYISSSSGTTFEISF